VPSILNLHVRIGAAYFLINVTLSHFLSITLLFVHGQLSAESDLTGIDKKIPTIGCSLKSKRLDSAGDQPGKETNLFLCR
jgi:hypothetical protein